MLQPLHLLLVEDNPLDAELLLHAVRQAGFEPIWQRAETEASYLALLDARLDIVLSDFHLPQFSGLRALQLRNERGLDVPFILVTGTIGEERAVEVMRLGATDYLLKDRLKRLGPAISHALARTAMKRRDRQQAAELAAANAALRKEIDDRRQAEATLRESEARFRQVVENIREVFWMTDATKQQMLYVSPAYETIWGRSQASLLAAPRTWLDHVHELDRERVAAAIARQTFEKYDETYRIVRPDGSVRWVRDRAFPIHGPDGTVERLVGVAEDISERKEFEEQLLRAQRLESVGMLASGIAHDLNNVLAPIGMAVPLLRANTRAPGDLRLLDTLERCTDRGAGLVRQILGFVHGIGGEPRLIQVKHLLRDITEVIRETFPKSIELEDEVPNDLWPIKANPTHVHQVLLNLCVNARDAMPNGGKLRLRAQNCSLDNAAAAAITGARPGAWLAIEVEDTGTGIPPEVLVRIWEPFFTTKAADKGTGLGLSTVRGIVETHRGFITLHTVPSQGTAFRVYFPALPADTSGPEPSPKAPAGRGRGQLVLVVDDEKPIREIASAILTQHGYRVITAGDGVEAIASFVPHAAEIALLITDLDMPSLDGAALAQSIHRLDPTKKILAMSGQHSVAVRHDQTGRPDGFISAFIAKPFTVEALLDVVEQLLRDDVATTTPVTTSGL